MVRFKDFSAHPNRGISRNFFHVAFSTVLRTNMQQIHTSSNAYLCSVTTGTRAIQHGPSENTLYGKRPSKIKIGESLIGGNRCPFLKIINTKQCLPFFLY